jgi:hypothetical protein
MVKRFSVYLPHYETGEIEESTDGEYVLHSDYAALAERCERLEAALQHERQKFDRSIAVLSRIYAVIHPQITEVNGKRYAFQSPLLNEQMQQLSDRIRAIPDELELIQNHSRESP